MKLVWTRPAHADRREIRDYIAPHNPDAAQRLDHLFQTKAAQLMRFPEMGRPGRLEGTSELIANPNYLLLYDVKGEVVRILRVLRTSRAWPPEM